MDSTEGAADGQDVRKHARQTIESHSTSMPPQWVDFTSTTP